MKILIKKDFIIIKKNNKSIYDGVIQLGKTLSYNNLLDINSALECINEFNEPTCVIIKHNNPCGVASSKNIASSFQNAYLSDKITADPPVGFIGLSEPVLIEPLILSVVP